MTNDELRAIYQAGAPEALAWPWDDGLRAVFEAGRRAGMAPLTDEQLSDLIPTQDAIEWCAKLWTRGSMIWFARAIERANGIKGADHE